MLPSRPMPRCGLHLQRRCPQNSITPHWELRTHLQQAPSTPPCVALSVAAPAPHPTGPSQWQLRHGHTAQWLQWERRKKAHSDHTIGDNHNHQCHSHYHVPAIPMAGGTWNPYPGTLVTHKHSFCGYFSSSPGTEASA